MQEQLRVSVREKYLYKNIVCENQFLVRPGQSGVTLLQHRVRAGERPGIGVICRFDHIRIRILLDFRDVAAHRNCHILCCAGRGVLLVGIVDWILAVASALAGAAAAAACRETAATLRVAIFAAFAALRSFARLIRYRAHVYRALQAVVGGGIVVDASAAVGIVALASCFQRCGV